MDNKKISRTIRWVYAGLMALVLAVALVAEYDVVPMEGSLIGGVDAKWMYGIEVGMFFLVGSCVLLVLKGFDRVLKRKMCTVSEEDKPKAYVGVYCVRLALLAIPMLLSVYFYYGLLVNWGLYYALTCFVSSLFCLPSPEGVEVEMKGLPHTPPKEG